MLSKKRFWGISEQHRLLRPGSVPLIFSTTSHEPDVPGYPVAIAGNNIEQAALNTRGL
jgi:hypothetical protein